MLVTTRFFLCARRAVALLGIALAALAVAPWQASAAAPGSGASPWFETEQGRVRLVAGGESEGRLLLGLQFEMAPGWKIYWRSPGDAGYPPSLDWKGSENLAEATVEWPAPKRFSLFGIDTVGYEKAVVLPVVARPRQAGAPVRLHAALDYLTCSEICVPYQAELDLDLPDPAAATGFRDAIDAARAAVPRPGALPLERLTLRPGDPARLELGFAAPPPAGADVFVEGPAGIGFGRPSARGDALLVPVTGPAEQVAALAGQSLTVTVVAPGVSSEERRAVAAGPPASGLAGGSAGGFAWILGLAVLGGLILNVMPCVLPVLSIKLLAVAAHGGRERRAVRAGFLATAAGVIFSFALLAAAMVALKSAGLAVGWGVQFQQPLFLVAMVVLVSLFACNLWGAFEITLPGWAGGVAGAAGRPGLAGEFLTGAFATLLATPCSAPFLGTAVGFALAGGATEIWTVFVALGFGLALPYLVVAVVPGLARLLPRPGRWMMTFRRALGLVLALTALWLLSVLAVQIGSAAAILVGLAMVALAAVLAALRRSRLRPAAALAAIAAAASVALLAPAPSGSRAEEGLWRPFDRAEVAEAVRAGKVVLVDVTADWCLTCQVNEKLVLRGAPVRRLLGRPDVVAMRADWTRPDAAIADYLRSFGRYGIPFNAVYGPELPGGQALSEILTDGEVVSALRRAGLAGG
jgi:suppressor for copper-sensitivity B